MSYEQTWSEKSNFGLMRREITVIKINQKQNMKLLYFRNPSMEFGRIEVNNFLGIVIEHYF